MAQFGEKVWFHIIGEDGIDSSVKRRNQGIFVGHHDRTRAFHKLPRVELCEAKAGQDRPSMMLGNRGTLKIGLETLGTW